MAAPAMFQCLTHLSERIFFPNTQFKSPLTQPEALSSPSTACSLGAEPDPHLATISFQGDLERDKVPLGLLCFSLNS